MALGSRVLGMRKQGGCFSTTSQPPTFGRPRFGRVGPTSYHDVDCLATCMSGRDAWSTGVYQLSQ